MASKFKFDLGIEIRNLNYSGIHVHVASNSHFGGLVSDLKIKLSDLDYL